VYSKKKEGEVSWGIVAVVEDWDRGGKGERAQSIKGAVSED
jgi:hypothetical protein